MDGSGIIGIIRSLHNERYGTRFKETDAGRPDPRRRDLSLYRGIINKTDDEVAVALANVLRVAIMNRLADAYGSIPYSKSYRSQSQQCHI